jgi:metallo-beta-lactamase class B
MRRRGLTLAGTAAIALLWACAMPHASTTRLPIASEVSLATDLVVQRVSDRAFVITHLRPWPANALLVEMPDSTLVLVNTTYSSEAAERLLAWIEAEFGRRPMIAIVTHFHADVLGGNEALLRRGIPVYGSDLTVKALAEDGERFRRLMLEWLESDEAQRERFRTATFLPPDHVFPAAAGLKLTFGGEEVRIMYPGPAHSGDNVVVFFPSAGIVFAGCLAMEGPRVGNLSDANLGAWPTAVHRVADLGARTVVPGHGHWAGPELLSNTLAILKAHHGEP